MLFVGFLEQLIDCENGFANCVAVKSLNVAVCLNSSIFSSVLRRHFLVDAEN